MQNIQILAATENDFGEVAELVTKLLIELAPNSAEKVNNMNLEQITKSLLRSSKIWAFLAKSDEKKVGVLTLHECAAIYAGGVFGEISELYVEPEYRSSKIGEMLISSATDKGKELGWGRLEVGSPPPDESPRTVRFYESKGFKYTGSRLRCLIG